MPSTTPERAARWPGGDQQAIAHLEGRGFILTRQWEWVPPPDSELSDMDADAVTYLIEEWDFGGVAKAGRLTLDEMRRMNPRCVMCGGRGHLTADTPEGWRRCPCINGQ